MTKIKERKIKVKNKKGNKMQNKYKVCLRDIKECDLRVTECNSETELSRLLTHLDKDKYEILSIDVDGDTVEDIKMFCKIESKLETG